MANFQTITITDAMDASTAYGTLAKYPKVDAFWGSDEKYPQACRVKCRATGNLGAAFTLLLVLVDPAGGAAAGGDFVKDVRTVVVTNDAIRCDAAGTAGKYHCTVAIDGGSDIFDLAGATKNGYEWRLGSPNTMNTATAVDLEFIPVMSL